MTTKIILLLAFLPSLLPAQLQWEYNYPGNDLQRQMLDQSGEIYLLAKNAACTVQLYDKNHSFWQTIALNPMGGTDCANYLLSEQYIDSDPELEIIYRWAFVDHHQKDGVVLQDNNGQIMLINKTDPNPQFSMPSGWVPKLLAGSTVYSLPGPVLEHDYGYGHKVYRIQAPDGSEQYLVYKPSPDNFTGYHFYTKAHEFIKTVHLSTNLTHISHDLLNKDPLYEFVGKDRVADSGPNRYRLNVVQEDGKILQSHPCESAYLNKIPNLPDRYLVTQTALTGESLTQVIGLSPWEILVEFKDKYIRRHALNGMEELFLEQNKAGDPALRIYDHSFSLIKIFTIPAPYEHFWNLLFTRNKFSSSGLLEICFTNERQGITYVTCLNENGQLLYDFPEAKEARLDQQAGMEDRFLVVYQDSTAVYRFNHSSSTGASNSAENILVTPNPFQSVLSFSVPAAASSEQVNALLRNTAGQTLARTSWRGPSADWQLGHLPGGLYFYELTTDSGLRAVGKVLKM